MADLPLLCLHDMHMSQTIGTVLLDRPLKLDGKPLRLQSADDLLGGGAGFGKGAGVAKDLNLSARQDEDTKLWHMPDPFSAMEEMKQEAASSMALDAVHAAVDESAG
jgi:hypothetical protein